MLIQNAPPILMVSLTQEKISKSTLIDEALKAKPDLTMPIDSDISTFLSSIKNGNKNQAIPIPIDTRFCNIVYSNGSESKTGQVSYDNLNRPIVNKASNRVTLQFDLSSRLSTVSTIASFFAGLAGLDLYTFPSVSFYSPSIVIENGWLVGISKGGCGWHR